MNIPWSINGGLQWRSEQEHARIKGAIHSTKIPTGPTGKKQSTSKGGPVFFENFAVGPNRSISGNFGRMDRADKLFVPESDKDSQKFSAM